MNEEIQRLALTLRFNAPTDGFDSRYKLIRVERFGAKRVWLEKKDSNPRWRAACDMRHN